MLDFILEEIDVLRSYNAAELARRSKLMQPVLI
jgi:hypothetical protein